MRLSFANAHLQRLLPRSRTRFMGISVNSTQQHLTPKTQSHFLSEQPGYIVRALCVFAANNLRAPNRMTSALDPPPTPPPSRGREWVGVRREGPVHIHFDRRSKIVDLGGCRII